MTEFPLTPDELAGFQKNGFAGPFPLYEHDEITQTWRRERIRLMDRSDAVYQDEAAKSGATNIANYDRHLDNAFLADHICSPQIVDRVSSILGPDVLCWRTEFFPKYPGDEGTDWHQADTFANASGTPQILWPNGSDFGGTITVWCAFTDAMVDTGCLQFIPGTHQSMNYDETKRMHYDPEQATNVEKDGVRRGFFGYDYRELQIDPDWKPDESQARSMEMPAGQFIVFWSTLMHASHPHSGLSKQMRLGFAARYVPTSVRIYPDTEQIEEYGGQVSLERYGAVLVSGENAYDHNRIATETTLGHPFPTRRR
ncbi:chlorinating enzyme [Actinokineospora spheciospongiae]|uniref:chlorinating enzyme n=1 Tax=Actinokineospora spheciospongiae TaxID=909613 RepID=UPI000D70FBEA|nr:chlorinating enzyme [Actinokineospora spheciospongiae]PWW59447.1 non-heme Fe2+,alpha-ketoglutarate-dependent halogenase [Actinokineospora spheciospongiae]